MDILSTLSRQFRIEMWIVIKEINFNIAELMLYHLTF